jgi:hypothetical protein
MSDAARRLATFQDLLAVGQYGDADSARIPPFEEVELAIGRLVLPPAPTEP